MSEDEKIYQECFVAFFDLLGFSKTVMNTEFKGVYFKILQLMQISNIARGLGGIPNNVETINAGKDHSIIKSILMSDSLLLFTNDGLPNSFKSLLSVSKNLINVGINGLLPMRGAISYGKFFNEYSSGIFFGPALIDAVNYEKIAKWAGVILTPACHDKLSSAKFEKHTSFTQQSTESFGKNATKNVLHTAPLIVEYNVQLEDKIEQMTCINWGFPHRCSRNIYALTRAFSIAGAGFNKKAEVKLQNTIEFHEYCDSLIIENDTL